MKRPLVFRGGPWSALVPFLVFLGGVAYIALSGSPDEKAFWPVLLTAIAVGLLLSQDARLYADTVIEGMSRPIVMVMVLAWMLASVIGLVMTRSGFVQALSSSAVEFGLGGTAFVVAAFLICCTVSLSTGTSFGTILVCGPLLFPSGASLGGDPALLIGSILAGATFGDSISPISDTTIASSLSQGADIGGTVKSRIAYVVPAGVLALVAYATVALLTSRPGRFDSTMVAPEPLALAMIAAPAVTLLLLLFRRHLLEGLMAGVLVALGVALGLKLVTPEQVFSLNPATYSAEGIVIEGMNRAVGISVFTMLLLGLVSGLEASSLGDYRPGFLRLETASRRSAEAQIVGATTGAVLLTTHSIVAILAVGDFARRTGERLGIGRYRRANLLDLTVVVFPFLLPYCIPVILAAGTTSSGSDFGVPSVSPLATGLFNFYSWSVLLVLVLAVWTGYGSRDEK